MATAECNTHGLVISPTSILGSGNSELTKVKEDPRNQKMAEPEAQVMWGHNRRDGCDPHALPKASSRLVLCSGQEPREGGRGPAST